MRKELGLVAAVLTFAGPAVAADLPLKAPAIAPAPIFSWTGWYLGANVGGGWSDEGGVDNTVNSNACSLGFPGYFGKKLGEKACAAKVPALNSAIPGHLGGDPSGVIGGVQLGYNFQAGAFVWGVETDFQGADIKGDGSVSNGPTPIPHLFFPDTLSLTGTESQKLDWFGTLRGRLGFLMAPQLLVYGTGGLAYGHVETDAAFTGHIQGLFPFDGATSISQTDTRVGWTVGGGLEWMIAPHWSIKGEYLYYDLGHATLDQTLTLNSTIPGHFVSANISSDAQYKGSIARLGINYHF